MVTFEQTALSRADLAYAKYDERGVFLAGRRAELDALRAMGARDASLGRLYEGHLNGALLVALYGTEHQRAAAYRDVADGHLFGVWNTQDERPVLISTAGSVSTLEGAKTWASGADTVTRALVTARRPDGLLQMCLVPLDRARPPLDAAAWKPLGMHDSNSFEMSFDGVRLSDIDLIGAPGDYEKAPWFLGGALRFVAVHAGIIERLCGETARYLRARNRSNDPLQLARLGEMRIATRSALNWVRTGEEAWSAYDAAPGPVTSDRVIDVADMARLAVERAGLDVAERAMRAVGARGLLEPLPFSRLIRDLQMYLRQPNPDGTLCRVGANGLRD
jgi:alkylation response protein AidB-like acyl-CoA dehydrogenase